MRSHAKLPPCLGRFTGLTGQKNATECTLISAKQMTKPLPYILLIKERQIGF